MNIADQLAAEPAYDRELIARMLTEYNHGYIGQFSPVAVEHQIKLLREAENRSAEGRADALRDHEQEGE